MDLETLTSAPAMITIAIIMAIGWGTLLEVSKAWLVKILPSTTWWDRATKPTISMMQNFGFPKNPTTQFPNAVTEPMARDFFAFLVTICFQHGLSALPMIPVVIDGWDNSTDLTRSLFVLGTLSDVGFDIYDAIKTTIRTFTKHHPDPIPLDFWVVIVAMHHTLAMMLVIPLNLKYIHLVAYHQTVLSLLSAASLCYTAGCYKFTLDITKLSQLLQYKFCVIFQLAVIVYTRFILWFPAMWSILQHFKQENDTTFYYAGCVMGFIFSVFNLLLLADALKATIKWLPMKVPPTSEEATRRKSELCPGVGGAPMAPLVFDMLAEYRRRKIKGAVHSVIAMNRLKEVIEKPKDS